jgi:copper resistance protein B
MRDANTPRRFAWPALAAALALASAPVAAQHEHHTPATEATESAPEHERAGHVAAPATATEAERAAAFPDLGGMQMGDMMLVDPLNKLVLVDRFESEDAPGSPLSWDLNAWVGRDLKKLWVRSEGERRDGEMERAEIEVLFGNAFARWWEVLAGMRHEVEPGESQDWAAVGVRGTAPYRFEIEATAYAANGGRAALRVETQRDLLVTNRLVLQPQVELNWHGESDPARLRGAGLADAELGLRLRYEIRREVAPYVGLVRERSFGRTAALLRNAGRDTGDTRLVAGIRVWF